MKKIVILAGLSMLVASASFAAVGDTWFGVQGGGAIPNGDFSDAVKTGYNASIYGSYGVAKSCALGAELGYHSFKGKGTGGDKLTVSPLQVTAFSTYAFPMKDSKSMPYIKVGAGIYNVKAKLDLPAPNGYDESKSKFGFNVGLGYNYEVSPMYSIGLNGAFHQIQTDKKATNVITVGAKLNFGMAKKK